MIWSIAKLACLWRGGKPSNVVTKSPTIDILAKDGTKIINYIISSNAILQVGDHEKIEAGTVLVKIHRESGKTRDITGGLPRVTELFEARSPSDPATVSEIDGTVHFEKPRRGSRVVVVTSHDRSDRRSCVFGDRYVLRHRLSLQGDVIMERGSCVWGRRGSRWLTGGAG